MRKSLLIVFIFMLGACASSYKHELNFNPTEPLRVVVLPFQQVNDRGELVSTKSGLAIDKVGVISKELKDSPPDYVRKLAEDELAKSSLDVFPSALVDSELSHHGFGNTDLTLNLTKIYAANPAQICTHLLNCDAVLYGKVTKWDRGYYALESVNTVGVELKLVSVKDGKVLFASNAADSEGRGLSGGPTGFSNLVIEPIRGLDSDIIANLAHEVVAKMISPLRVENRPDYLKTSPPSIYAAAHDAKSGVVSKNGHLTVLAFGTPKMTATFSLGGVIQNIPMAEEDESHYFGEYFPLPTDQFSSQPVYVYLTDEFGRSTKEEVANGKVSVQ